MSQPGTVLVRLHSSVLKDFGTRTDDGKKLVLTLGKPTEYAIGDEPVYTPVVGYVDDGMVMVRRGYFEYLEDHQCEGGAR